MCPRGWRPLEDSAAGGRAGAAPHGPHSGDRWRSRNRAHGGAFPADAEDDFLLKPQRCIPAVKAAGDGAVIRIVLGDIRIEQQDRHRAARRALQNMQPRADPDRPLDNRHSHHSGQGTSPKLRVPWILYISLATGRVQFLPEIACAADQGDENNWQIEIGRRARRIPGEDAEPAAIGRHFRSDRDFHREVGDPGSAREAVMVEVSAQLRVPAGRRLVHCLTVSVCGKRAAENGWAIRFVSSISSSAIKPNASARVISSPCSGPKWNNSRAGGKRMTPARMAAAAATTHHSAALGRVKAAKTDALNERLTSTRPRLAATSAANASERASGSGRFWWRAMT